MKTVFTIHVDTPKTRRIWPHDVNPCQKAFKSKRDYNRHDKSWKKEY